MDPVPASVVTLRPLGIGEILDRAVTLTVRNFPVLAAIALVFAVPQALFTYFGTQDQAKVFETFLNAITAAASGKEADADALIRSLSDAPVFNGYTVALWLWFAVALPTSSMALVWAAARAYLGRGATFSSAYAVVARRAPSLVLIAFIFVAIGILVFATLFIVIFVVALGSVFLIAVSHNRVFEITAAVIAILAWALLVFATAIATSLWYLSLHIAWMTNVIERVGPIAAVVRAAQRVLARPVLRRSILITLAYLALSIGYLMLSVTATALTFGLLHSNVGGIAIGALLQVCFGSFVAVYFMLYYFDIRVRREGLDLSLGADEAGTLSGLGLA